MSKIGNGGYALIDLSGTDLTAGSKVTISGMYKSLSRAIDSKKIIVGANLMDGSKTITPSALSVLKNGSDIEATVGVNKITVDEDDGVVVSSLITGGAKTTKKA